MSTKDNYMDARAQSALEPSRDRLDSWKQIAVYLGREVRTVQRWEQNLCLPVHRPRGKNRSAVVAFPEELDQWLHQTPIRAGLIKDGAENWVIG